MALTQVDQGLLSSTAQYTGFKNRIINGAMGISQRAAVNTNVAITTTTSGTFGPDRFTGYTGTGSLWNISQVSTSAYDFPYAMRIQRIAGQTSTSAVYARQVIETANCKDLAGQTVTLSFYATAGANYSGSVVNVQIYTGTAADQGTSSLNTGAWTGFASPLSDVFTPTTTRTKFTFTATLGATVQEVAFGMNWSGSGTAGANDYLDITGVQLEKGSTATSFDYRPYGAELALCQRYYYRIRSSGTIRVANGFAVSTTLVDLFVQYPTTMRTAPTALEQTGTATDYAVQYLATSATCSAVPTFVAATEQGTQTRYTTAAVLTAGNGLIGRVLTGAYLGWSAEL
jgi:hypothetical protein